MARSAFRASRMAIGARWEDMRTGWVHAELPRQAEGDRDVGVRLLFEGERLDGYRLWIVDPRYGTSWDDASEEKQLAQRDAHDEWLVEMLGPGVRTQAPGGMELTYSLSWGNVWSTYDPRSADSSIGVRFRQKAAGARRRA
jgi:hypothetical protein